MGIFGGNSYNPRSDALNLREIGSFLAIGRAKQKSETGNCQRAEQGIKWS